MTILYHHIFSSFAWKGCPEELTGQWTIFFGPLSTCPQGDPKFLISCLRMMYIILKQEMRMMSIFYLTLALSQDSGSIIPSQKFSSPTPNKLLALAFINMTDGRSFGKYLGYPNDLQFLLENFKYCLAGWKVNLLAAAGRATLIRSTLNCLPNHVMQLIKVPDHIIDKMERCERSFYWGTTPTHKKLHLLKWCRITQPKDSGGLGIQDLRTKNKASCVNCLETFPITQHIASLGTSPQLETPIWLSSFVKLLDGRFIHRIPASTFFPFCLWAILLARNKYIFEGHPFLVTPRSIVNMAISGISTVGGVLRNSVGDWILGFTGTWPTSQPLEMEMRPLLLRLTLALQYGMICIWK
ncbi:hypothetical protein KY285_001563 [Solanum tuberosum]|nr:hypothetical protein KY289_001841 [Solanum tuberosum]KAH0765692.1 hypothetical protein KY285_001563 [Solanum tuberosum]